MTEIINAEPGIVRSTSLANSSSELTERVYTRSNVLSGSVALDAYLRLVSKADDIMVSHVRVKPGRGW